ncbi:MAG: AIDA repeat-containing protein, partial [Desulfovibrio sp.]|nr:AIDA repeat-containing protein [Desulfovibrio sp.]
VSAGGWQIVTKKGIARSTTIKADGVLQISSGGTASAATIRSEGQMIVQSGGVAYAPTLLAGGSLTLNKGAIVSGMSLGAAGTVTVEDAFIFKGNNTLTKTQLEGSTSATVAGAMKKGTAKNDTLTGNANSDIFYGGKGNDKINGKNGRDVAVYDTTAWGKDVIAKTSGTMTLLFNGVKAGQITKKQSGSTMTITRKSDKKQSITVNGWSDDTHNIVYASGMTAFNKYIKAAKPTTAQTTAARTQVWKKAGLAS